MERKEELLTIPHLLGLIGYPLSHSFSKKYFADKFAKENISGYFYDLFPLEDISLFKELVAHYPNLKGINVTIPYKEQVIPFLDDLDDSAKAVEAVNTIKFTDKGLIGYNTDVYGFEVSLRNKMEEKGVIAKNALVLGTGGAAKACAAVLKKMGIAVRFVSRRAEKEMLTYEMLTKQRIEEVEIIVNTTPLGMSPNINTCPNIPYSALSGKHLLFDLVYNPEITLFLEKGNAQGAATLNGLEMLHLQAEKAWSIWQEK